MSLVTIISDASYCPRTHAAGYGFWAVSHRGRHAGGGSFKSGLDGASTAETMAIVNALHVTLSLGIAEKGDKVLIQTDCLFAIHLLTGVIKKAERRHPDSWRAFQRFIELRAVHELAVDFRHVRGHTKVDDQRSKAQRHSDKRARDGMKKARARAAA